MIHLFTQLIYFFPKKILPLITIYKHDLQGKYAQQIVERTPSLRFSQTNSLSFNQELNFLHGNDMTANTIR